MPSTGNAPSRADEIRVQKGASFPTRLGLGFVVVLHGFLLVCFLENPTYTRRTGDSEEREKCCGIWYNRCMKNILSILRVYVGLLLSCSSAFADVSLDVGRWKVEFKDAESRLVLSHAEGFAKVDGRLGFMGPSSVTGAGIGKDGASFTGWRVVSPRDGVQHRLALEAVNGNVNGYVTFQSDGEGISMLVYHRTAFAYEGTLSYEATVRYRDDAYACSLTAKNGDRVLSVKSGPAVSINDDALYSPSFDEALQISGGVIGKGCISAKLDIADSAANELSFKIVKGWYKNRWVPYWRPLDRKRAPCAPTGWLSWNTYFDTAGSKENLDEARFAAQHFKPFGMEIWNIESWQDNSPKLPVRNFHNMNLETYKVQFPEGMKWLADEIRKLGFKPGLWMAPFGTGNTNFYKAHTDWFLHDASGRPISCWNGHFTLDPTVPAAREHLKRIFDTASHEWGYEFFKIDGMSGRGHGYCAHLYERPEIRARFSDPSCPNPFELCVKAFREGIGDDRIFLACQGHFTGAEAAYADASRTGADIVHPNEPVKWNNILLQARCTVNQIFAHSNVFWCDPDCMLVSQSALEREQAQVEATIVALPGQQTFAGDKLMELAPDRVRLIQQSLPVCPTQPAKLYPQFGYLPVWDLHVSRPFGDWHVVALFNWGDEVKNVGFRWDEIGESPERRFVGWEFWSGRFLGALSGSVELSVPPRGVRLVALQPDLGHPQFLSSDRHITQGAIGLKDQRWQDGKLTVKAELIGGFKQTLRFAVPEGYEFKSVAVDGAKASAAVELEGRIVAVTVESADTAPKTIELIFAN